MRKKLGCLHVHHSNINYIEKILSPYNVECIHFVDPGLMHRVTSDDQFQESHAHQKVQEQIKWIVKCGVDAILITCTHYIALLQENLLPTHVPIIKIDEPYFEKICQSNTPQVILFTNPATVDGTMKRLRQYAESRGQSPNLEVIIIEDTFPFMMQGQMKEYNQKITDFLQKQVKLEEKNYSVAQLSMADAAKQAEQLIGIHIINPLETLTAHIVHLLKLDV